MTPAGYSRLAAVLMGAASIGAAHAQGGFAIRQNHDGIYAVDVVTRLGSCDRDYHWLIAVCRKAMLEDISILTSGQLISVHASAHRIIDARQLIRLRDVFFE
jgi:hypothetical protein